MRMHPPVVALMLAAAVSMGAQEPPPTQPGDRGGRGAAIRDFLGLGAAPDAADAIESAALATFAAFDRWFDEGHRT